MGGAWKLYGVAAVSAIVLAVILTSVFLWIMKKRVFKQGSEPGERRVDREQPHSETRGAAMSLTAAASGFVVFLLSVPVIQGQKDWGLTCAPTQICALKGSTAEIRCSYRSPSRLNDADTAVEETFWFTRFSDNEPVDLRADSEYSGRVQYHCGENDCTLRITDLRESDSAEYKFRFITNQPGRKYTGEPGVTLSVTGLQVQVIKSTADHNKYFHSMLKCHSSCRLPDHSSYIWYKNGQKNRTETPSFSDYVHSADSFTCALKGHEDFSSPSVCVSGRSCNRVIYTDRRICVSKGSSVNISCTYNSYSYVESKFWFSPERRRRWQNASKPEDLSKDSQYSGHAQVLEAERGRSTLRITDLTERDSAEYRFKFKTLWFEWGSSLPGTTLTVIALEVQVTRLITGHQSYTEAELKCLSSCSPAGRLYYVWFKNGEQIMKEGSSYKDRFYPGDVISCALRGHENYGSPSVYALKVPSVSVNPPGEIMEGGSVTLTCNSNSAANYTWYKENLPLPNKEPQLVFNSIQSSDSGQYYCAAENELGRRTSDHKFIDVKHAPKLLSVSVSPSGEIVEGSSVTLTCSSDANPAAKYTWYKENQTLFQGPEGSYNFTSISSEDRGMYYCKSENQYGKINSTSLSLDVHYAPKLLSASVEWGKGSEGSSVTLTCSSDANPAANYTWYKENEDSPKASGQIFTITDLRPEHSGNYYCEAQNTRGRRNSTLNLIVVAGAWKLYGVAAVSAIVLAVILTSVFLWIMKKRVFKQGSEPGERRVDREQIQPAEQQDNLHYASVHFSKDHSVSSNIRPAPPRRHKKKKKEEEEMVEYAAVVFKSASAAARTRGQEAPEDPAALYSTVNKPCKKQCSNRPTGVEW